jgi:hypothetical protein
MKIYTVFGTTGEYSDYQEWPVISYLDEKKAQVHVVEATKRAKEWEVKRKASYEKPRKGWNKFDPDMAMDYTGTDYEYYETEIADWNLI